MFMMPTAVAQTLCSVRNYRIPNFGKSGRTQSTLTCIIFQGRRKICFWSNILKRRINQCVREGKGLCPVRLLVNTITLNSNSQFIITKATELNNIRLITLADLCLQISKIFWFNFCRKFSFSLQILFQFFSERVQWRFPELIKNTSSPCRPAAKDGG